MQRLANALLSLVLVAAELIGTSATAQDKSFPWPTRDWSVSSPEEQGMSSERLARLVDFGSFNNMDSLLVTRHGRILLEATYAPFRPEFKHRINSATKGVISMLIAQAVRDGRLDSIDRKVVDFFPERTIAHLDERKKAMTVRHLLDMTSGLQWKEGLNGDFDSSNAMQRTSDWPQYVLDQPMAAAPGTMFYYNSGNSHLLSAILSKVTGKSALDHARETLFGPLGIEDVTWQADPQGISIGGHGLYLRTRDMAKFGTLYLRGGVWEGKQIVPASWIEDVRQASIDMREVWSTDYRYSRQFWVIPKRDVLMAVGYHRQLIIVMPKRDIVATVTGSARFSNLGGMPSEPRYGLDTLLGYLEAAATADAPLAADPVGAAELAQKVKEAAIARPGKSSELPAMAKAVSGKTWRFDSNDIRIKSVTFKFDGSVASYEFEVTGPPGGSAPAGRFGGPIGLDGHYRVGARMPSGLGAARGIWEADGAQFVLEAQTLGNDDAVRATHRFGDNTVEITLEYAGGFRTTLQGRAD